MITEKREHFLRHSKIIIIIYDSDEHDPKGFHNIFNGISLGRNPTTTTTTTHIHTHTLYYIIFYYYNVMELGNISREQLYAIVGTRAIPGESRNSNNRNKFYNNNNNSKRRRRDKNIRINNARSVHESEQICVLCAKV